MDTTSSSICSDILSFLISNHSTFPLNSLNVQTVPASSESLFSYSPPTTTLNSFDLNSEAYRSLWAPKQGEVEKVAVRDESSEEVSCDLLPQLDQETVDLYKTELCRSFEEHGFCKYGTRCRFAHGRQDLREVVDRHPKYKTQLCKTFHTTGICRYGKRCHFIHNEDGGNKTQRLTHPQQQQQQKKQQQQQHPVSGLRKLTGRQNTKSLEEEEQQQLFQAYSIFPTPSISSSSTSRYFEEQSSPVMSRTSLPSSTSSSPSPTLPSINDDDTFSVFQPSSFSTANDNIISQNIPPIWRKTSPSPSSFSPFPGSAIDLLPHPSSILHPTMATDSASFFPFYSSAASVQQKGISSSSSSSSRGDEDRQSCERDVVDLILSHLTKSQKELLVEHLLFQTQKRNASI